VLEKPFIDCRLHLFLVEFCVMKRSLALVLLCAAFAPAQTTEKPAKPAPPEPFAVDVSGAAWEQGELRTCSTYFQHPKMLLCDDDARVSILIGFTNPPNADAPRKIDPEHFLLEAMRNSKRFLVQFSQLPWRFATPDPDKPSDEPAPVFTKPDAPDLESQWDCSKEKVITCKFLKNTKPI